MSFANHLENLCTYKQNVIVNKINFMFPLMENILWKFPVIISKSLRTGMVL